MGEDRLKHIEGKKIRRQYFNVPLIILYSLMLAVPYSIFIISLCIGRFNSYEWPSTFWISVWVCFWFSTPLLVLKILNRHCFGRIICVLTDEGMHYPKGYLCWETIEKIEYAIDTKPRYKSDPARAYRVIVYTQGGKRVILANAPLYIVTCIKKYCKDVNIKISGASSLVHVIIIMAAILGLCPFYVVLLWHSPGASLSQLIVSGILCVVCGVIRIHTFDTYAIPYRFWRRILPKKWLSYIILAVYYSSFFVALLILCYFPNWLVVSLVGIYMGFVQPPIPSRHGRRRSIRSYEQLYDIYINKADFWEKNIEKRKTKRINKI